MPDSPKLTVVIRKDVANRSEAVVKVQQLKNLLADVPDIDIQSHYQESNPDEA